MRAYNISFSRRIRFLARNLRLDVQRWHPETDVDVRRLGFLRELSVATVIDGGANVGQWARSLRRSGYRGLIISFEPLTDAFAGLRLTSAGDPSWHCVQAALGDVDTELQMNVAGNSVSSSLLLMEAAHVNAAPKSAYVRTEKVRVTRLDSALPALVPGGTNLALKLDLQGYEAMALAGAQTILADVCLIECELSIVPLYQGQPLYRDLINLLDGLGFSLASLSEGLIDPSTGDVMQLDAIFVREHSAQPTPV